MSRGKSVRGRPPKGIENADLILDILSLAGPAKTFQEPAKKAGAPKSMEEMLAMDDPKARHLRDASERLLKAEKAGELVWMDYQCWLASGNLFQRELRARVDPLFWGYAYFDLRDFVKNLEHLHTKLAGYMHGSVFRDSSANQMVIYSSKRDVKEYSDIVHKGLKQRLDKPERLFYFNNEVVRDGEGSYLAAQGYTGEAGGQGPS
jgi:hypothetical protein